MKVRFNLRDDNVHLVDYVKDPVEENPLESWNGVEGLISMGAESIFLGQEQGSFCGTRVLVNLT